MNENEYSYNLYMSKLIDSMTEALNVLTHSITELTANFGLAAAGLILYFKRLQCRSVLIRKGFPDWLAFFIANHTPEKWLPEFDQEHIEKMLELLSPEDDEEEYVDDPPPGSLPLGVTQHIARDEWEEALKEAGPPPGSETFPLGGVTQEQWEDAIKESTSRPAFMGSPTLMPITDVPLICLICDWSGTVGTAEPDCDGDGSLGCPDCGNILDSTWPRDDVQDIPA